MTAGPAEGAAGPAADRLRLRAEDEEDLAVIAACLQDARVTLREMAFVKDEGRFMAAFLRYRHERRAGDAGGDGWTRCPSALVFDGVEAVRYRGIDTDDAERELHLLTVLSEATPDGAEIVLVFKGNGAIRLQAPRLRARLRDFGECAPCDPPETPLLAPGGAGPTNDGA